MPTSHLHLDSLPQTFNSQIVSASSLHLSLPQPPRRFFRHGWQSWSLAAWTDLTPLPVQQPKLLRPMQIDPVYADETAPHSSWVAAVEIADKDILLLGALGLGCVRSNDDQLQGQYEAGEGR
jgi:alpha-galactosidase